DDDSFSGARNDLLGELLGLAQLVLAAQALGDVEGQPANAGSLHTLGPERVVVLPEAALSGPGLDRHDPVERAARPDRLQVMSEAGPRFRRHDVPNRSDFASQMRLPFVTEAECRALIERDDLSVQ